MLNEYPQIIYDNLSILTLVMVLFFLFEFFVDPGDPWFFL